jgi:UDP-GlcNAc:undecaprenyl-phosphate GlcNAc-1-phosphate transferase
MLSLFIGVAVALAVCLLARPLGSVLGVMDMPDGGRKLHAAPTPEVGGIAVVLGLLPSMALQAYGGPLAPYFLTVGAAVVGFTAIGYLDDRSHIRPAYRLTFGVLLTLGVLWLVPGELVGYLHFSFLDVAVFPARGLSVAFTVLCVVGLQNAVNMADGKNGLAVGMLLIWSAFLWWYAPPDLTPVLVTLLGGLAVTWFFNMRGAVFLGDAGTYGLGVAVAFFTIHSYAVNFPELHADVVALWFLVPVVDALRLMATRIAAGQSPFAPDRRHFHHLLQVALPRHSGLRLGIYLGLVAIPGVLAALNPDYVLAYGAGTLLVYSGIILSARSSAVPRHRSTTVRLDSGR